MSVASFADLFYVDMLSVIMICLVSFVGIIVCFFSKKYMKGDARYSSFFWNIFLLLLSVAVMAIADNLFLFLSAWCCSNLMLVRLIVHKPEWKAAKASGRLALHNFMLGCFSVMVAFFCMYKATGAVSIQYIVHDSNDSWYMFFALIMILIGAMTQSAIWPFHRWLISSLNSPTPVSAIMHAGIVNGGGFLLARFAPLYFSMPSMLSLVFIVGIVTALLGSLWKMMQHDVKRMLAFSTMGQMGFMLAQCGLGFFTGAIAHLCWHGMFKAYLFLSSGGSAQEKRLNFGYPPTLLCFVASLFCGALSSYVFLRVNNEVWLPLDTTLIVVGIVFIAGAQLALVVLRDAPFRRLPLAMIITAAMGTVYGLNIYFFDLLLSSLDLIQPQPLNFFHVSSLVLLVAAWLSILFVRYSHCRYQLPQWLLCLYVKMFNSSQPHPTTITAYRKAYNYVQDNHDSSGKN